MYECSRCDTAHRGQPGDAALLDAARDDVEDGRTRRQQQQDRRHGKYADRRSVWNDDVHAASSLRYECRGTLAVAGQTCQRDRRVTAAGWSAYSVVDARARGGCGAGECWSRMRTLAVSYSSADSTPISLRRRCSRISSRRCSAFVCRRAADASRMCAASFTMKGRKTWKVPKPPVHSSNLAAPWVLNRLTVSVVLYTATSVANAHTATTVAHTGSQSCCHHGVADRSMCEAIPDTRAIKSSERLIHRHAMCLNRRGASTNRRSRTYSITMERECERTER